MAQAWVRPLPALPRNVCRLPVLLKCQKVQKGQSVPAKTKMKNAKKVLMPCSQMPTVT